ncbi:MAG: sodium:solute symporter family protein [Gemmatimonadales bacterium]
MTTALAAVLAYMLVQFGIGVWASRRIKTEDDYLVAGRRLGYPLAIFSLFATWFGAETIVGSAGTVVRDGVSLASAEPFGYGLCLILMGLVFAVPLWRRRLTTLADLFRTRYSPTTERVAATILIPSSILWAAAQVRAFGHVLASGSTLEVEAAVALAAGFTILYTVFGGLLVDAITDFIQGAVLVLGLVVLLGAVLHALGGVQGAAVAVAASDQIRLAGSGGASPLAVLEAWAIPVCGSVIATELVARIIATRSPEVARRSALTAGGLYLAVGVIPVFIGLVGVRLVPGLADPEQLLPAVARELLPTLLYALFAGGLISAILSTVDSTLLVSSGLLSHNVIVPLLRTPDERLKVRIARAGVLVFGLAAYGLALHADGVFALVEQASAFGGAGALVTVAFGLFTTIGGAKTATATMVGGVAAYGAGLAIGLPYPFLASLAASLAIYIAGATLEAAV